MLKVKPAALLAGLSGGGARVGRLLRRAGGRHARHTGKFFGKSYVGRPAPFPGDDVLDEDLAAHVPGEILVGVESEDVAHRIAKGRVW